MGMVGKGAFNSEFQLCFRLQPDAPHTGITGIVVTRYVPISEH